MTGRPRFPVLGVLICLGGLSVCIQYVTMTKFWVLPPSQHYGTLGEFLTAVEEQQIPFGALDGLLAGLFLLAAAALLYGEFRHRALTEFLRHCFACPRRTLWLLAASVAVCGRFYFARGEPTWAADASHHLVHAWTAARAIADGQLPFWTFSIGAGSPVFHTYGFVFFYLTGLVDLLLGDFFLSLKLIMGAAHMLASLGMYLLAASLCRSRPAGFVAGLAYALCFWPTQHVLIMGRFPLSLFYAFLPWTFWCVEQVLDSPRRIRAAVLGGAGLALLSFTHPGYGAFAMALAGCYSVARLWSCRRSPDRAGILRAGLLLFALGIVFGSYMNVGMYFERAHTRMHDFAIDLSTSPDPTWLHLLSWSNYRFWLVPPEPLHWFGGYLGISLCAIALAGGAAALRRREGRFAACWICLLLTLVVIFAYRWPPISSLPLIHAFNASRYLLFLTFFLSIAAGIGARMLMTRAGRGPGPDRWCALLVLALGVDLFPATFIQPYGSPANTPTGWPPEMFSRVTDEARPFEERGELPGYRAQWLGEGIYSTLRRARMLYIGKTPISETFHPGELRIADTFTNPFVEWAHGLLTQMQSVEQLMAHPARGPLLAGLHLLNTRYLVATSDAEVFAYGFSLDNDGPVRVSGRLAGYEDDHVDLAGMRSRFGQDLDYRTARALWIITRTGLDHGPSLSCERILVRGLEGEVDQGTSPEARVLYHRVDYQQVEMRVVVSAKCHARLAYGYWPWLEVTVDGEPVRPLETAGRFMAVPLEAGEHDIAITARLSPLRKGLLALAAVTLAAAVALALREGRKARG